ncbi:MAG: DUF2937 family protein [Pseudomonadota bacterium]
MLGLRLAASVLSGTLAAQAPAFTDQYAQRVGGAAQELAVVARDFERQATAAGLTPQEALARLTGAQDSFVAGHGADVARTLARASWLKAHHQALTAPGPFRRFGAFTQGADPDLVQGTWQDYRPAIPTTTEGLAFAALGFLLVYAAPSLAVRRRRKSH